jgi:hypothetical protein
MQTSCGDISIVFIFIYWISLHYNLLMALKTMISKKKFEKYMQDKGGHDAHSYVGQAI